MAEGARVESVEALTRFRVTLIKFAEAVQVALVDGESEMGRLQLWLELEQIPHWESQIRLWKDNVERCKEAVRMKQLFKDATGTTQSVVDEMKRLKMAQAKLEEAERKHVASRTALKALPREQQVFKGGVQRLATTLGDNVPAAVGLLAAYASKLNEYLALEAASAAGPDTTTSTSAAAVTRPTEEIKELDDGTKREPGRDGEGVQDAAAELDGNQKPVG